MIGHDSGGPGVTMPRTPRRTAVTLTALLATSAALRAQAEVCPNHLATIEPDGTVSSGSKERVRQAARGGLPLRVGWHVGAATEQRRGVDHWADAAFVTEF